MKFLITSAGIRNGHIAKALIDMAGKPASELSFLFVPTAANLEPGDKGWLIDNMVEFQKQGFKLLDIIDVAVVPVDNWQARFEAADIICFGGGNEQYLAKTFEKIGMKDFLVPLLKDKVYMGISAGSMVSAQFIPHELMKVVYPEENYPAIAPPLGLVDFCFIPHLNSEWFAHVRKEVLDGIKGKIDQSVYSTDDETAIKIIDGQVELVGEGESWVFKK